MSRRNISWPVVALILAAWLPGLASLGYGAVIQWSKTASSNASADPTINWREGQPPSSVNDSARAMMAALAGYTADTSGALVTTGTSTAYALTTNGAYTGETLTAIDGRQIAFQVNANNGATVVINVDSLGNQPLRSAPGVELAANTLIQGTPYRATYSHADGAWYLQNFFGSNVTVPVGGLIAYTGTTSPNASFLLPQGQAISRTTYAAYFALVGTTFGTGDGTTTFNIPDLRGRMIAGLDAGGSGRITVAGGNYDGTGLGNPGGFQNETLTQAQLPAVGLTGTITQSQTFATGNFSLVTAAGPGGVTGLPQNISILNIDGMTIQTQAMGSGLSHPIMPPSMVLGYLLRVL